MDARRVTVCAVSLSTVLAASLAWTAPSSAADRADLVPGPDSDSRLLTTAVHGRTALSALGSDLEVAAARNQMSAARLGTLLATDRSAWLDAAGRLYYVEPTLAVPDTATSPSRQGRTTAAAAPYPLDRTFSLHSDPGSTKTIYLDFDGQRVADSIWNDNTPLRNGFYGGWSLDPNTSAFNENERSEIQSIWQRVAEDYASFDIDVTTADPGAAGLTRSGPSDLSFGTRALFTQSDVAHKAVCGGTCGGVAYVGTFDAVTGTSNYVQPAWIFPKGLGPNDTKFMAEAATHEVGHTLGLGHDGTSSIGYFTGQGSWAPIMGVGYGEPITQWSRGEYPDANNRQDDYAVMRSHGLASRADEAGDSRENAAPLVDTTVTGYITDPSDQDVYLADRSCTTPFAVAAHPAPTSPDLDIRLSLIDATGEVIESNDPASGGTGDVATGMAAAIGSHAGPGAFFIKIDGVGQGNPATTGYTDYGSVGRYTLTVSNVCTIGPPSAPRPVDSRVDAPNGTVTVTWGTPISDGSAPISGYLVRRDGEDVATVGPDQHRYTFSGLALGTPLMIGVRAVNANGDGPVSTVRTVVAPVPGAPKALRTDRGSRHVELRWSAPKNAAAAFVTSYRVRMFNREGSPLRAVSVPARARMFTWRRLSNGSPYGFSVSAVSSRATGPSARTSAVIPARAPSRPGSPSARSDRSARGHVVHLRWRAPVHDGGLAVTGYRIQKLLLSPRGTVLRHVLGPRVGGRVLSRGVTVPRAGRWSFRVRAINPAGVGGGSRRSNVVRVP